MKPKKDFILISRELLESMTETEEVSSNEIIALFILTSQLSYNCMTVNIDFIRVYSESSNQEKIEDYDRESVYKHFDKYIRIKYGYFFKHFEISKLIFEKSLKSLKDKGIIYEGMKNCYYINHEFILYGNNIPSSLEHFINIHKGFFTEDTIKKVIKLSPIAFKVLAYSLIDLDFIEVDENRVTYNKSYKNKMKDNLGVSIGSINKAISDLSHGWNLSRNMNVICNDLCNKSEFLVNEKGKKGTYQFNLEWVWKGKLKEREYLLNKRKP